MKQQQRKKFEKLLKALDEGQTLIRELLKAADAELEEEAPSDFDAQSCLASLKTLDRSTAESQLSEMKQNELGALFVETKGPLSDKRKPKVWLVEQLLWRIFDFERGHDAIRSKGGKN